MYIYESSTINIIERLDRHFFIFKLRKLQKYNYLPYVFLDRQCSFSSYMAISWLAMQKCFPWNFLLLLCSDFVPVFAMQEDIFHKIWTKGRIPKYIILWQLKVLTPVEDLLQKSWICSSSGKFSKLRHSFLQNFRCCINLVRLLVWFKHDSFYHRIILITFILFCYPLFWATSDFVTIEVTTQV